MKSVVEVNAGDACRFREIRRDILRDADGSEKRYEHELVHEQASFYHEKIQRDLIDAKNHYIEEHTQELEGQLRNWQDHNLLKYKEYHHRTQEALMENKKQQVINFEELLKTEADALEYSYWNSFETIRKLLGLKGREKKPPKPSSTIPPLGSKYVLLAMEAVKYENEEQNKTRELLKKITKENKKRHKLIQDKDGSYYCKEPPIFPFQSDYMGHQTITEMYQHRQYLSLLLHSKGKAKSLLIPIIEQLLTNWLLTANEHTTRIWPNLLRITQVKTLNLNQTPFDQFGSGVGEQVVGFCEVEIGKQIFSDVRLEMALLVNHTQYSIPAGKGFHTNVIDKFIQDVEKITDAQKLINLDPKNPVFDHLRKTQQLLTQQPKAKSSPSTVKEKPLIQPPPMFHW